MINDQPLVAAPKPGIVLHASFHLFGWQVRDRSRDSASHPPVTPLSFTGSSLLYYLERELVLNAWRLSRWCLSFIIGVLLNPRP